MCVYSECTKENYVGYGEIVCVFVCVFIKLHITVQCGPVMCV